MMTVVEEVVERVVTVARGTSFIPQLGPAHSLMGQSSKLLQLAGIENREFLDEVP
jgi:hypothetical protein